MKRLKKFLQGRSNSSKEQSLNERVYEPRYKVSDWISSEKLKNAYFNTKRLLTVIEEKMRKDKDFIRSSFISNKSQI
jgi:hypothetical protein